MKPGRLIEKHRPEPEDEAAAQALRDGGYSHAMLAYDRELSQLFDPIWEEEYLALHTGRDLSCLGGISQGMRRRSI
jgi:hypothetical protein